MTIPGTYTPEQVAELEARRACPYWQRLNPLGWCVPRWWSGGVAARLIDGVAVVAGFAVIGLIITEASKVHRLQPVIEKIKDSQQSASFLRNRPGRGRSGRRRRRRR